MIGRVRTLVASPGRAILLGRAVAQAGVFAVSAAPVVVLANTEFNELTVALTVVVLVVVAPAGAFHQHLARVGVARRGAGPGLRPVVVVTAALAVVALAVAWALTGRHAWVPVVVLGGALLALGAWSATVLANVRRFLASATVEAVGGIVMVALAAVAVAASLDVGWWAAAFAIGGAATAVAGRVLAARATPLGVDAPTPPLPRLLRGAAPLLVIGVLAMAYNRTDLLILDQLAPARETTTYALAGRFVGPILIALGSLNNSLFPLLVDPAGDAAGRRALCRRYAVRLVAASAALVPVIVAGTVVVGSIAGSVGELDVVAPVFVLALATVPFAAAIPYGYLLSAVGREWVWMAGLAAGLAVDAVAVAWFAHDRALHCAIVWLVVQVLLWLATMTAMRRWGFWDRAPLAAGADDPVPAVEPGGAVGT